MKAALILIFYGLLTIAPLIMLDANWLWTILFTAFILIMPTLGSIVLTVLYCIGLYVCITQPQDWFSIVYYILFAITVLPITINFFSKFINKQN